MSLLRREELEALSQKSDGFFVSIFMPTDQTGPSVQQGPIRLKNLLRQAEEGLVEQGLRAPEARALLEPAVELLQDNPFWQHQSDGLALYLTSNMLFRTYRLPLDFEELCVVSPDRFHIKPLLPLLSGSGQFYILALSQNQVRLLQGSGHNVHAVELEELPESLAEALRFDDPEKQLQWHTGTSNVRGERPAMFFGQGGGGEDDQKTNLLRYFQQIDAGLKDFLKHKRAPLVLAGVKYLFPIYKEANNYEYLLEDGIPGNPEELSHQELHQLAWPVVEPYFAEAQKRAADRYQLLANTSEQASNDLSQIVPAAYYGRIDTLFVAANLQKWGSFDPANARLEIHEAAQPGDEDLLDVAAIQTLLNNGVVYAVAPEEVPDGGPAAAIFRY